MAEESTFVYHSKRSPDYYLVLGDSLEDFIAHKLKQGVKRKRLEKEVIARFGDLVGVLPFRVSALEDYGHGGYRVFDVHPKDYLSEEIRKWSEEYESKLKMCQDVLSSL